MSPPRGAISMVTLGVADLKRAIAFYENGLGWQRQRPHKDSIAFFELNGTWLGLYPWHELAKDAYGETRHPGMDQPMDHNAFRGVTLSHNLQSEAEVDTIMATAIEAGAQLIKTPQSVFWGGYSGYFRDPDGHLWELAYNPFAWVGPKDSE